jgi:hypothetical protein
MPIDPVLHKQDVGRHALIPVGFRRRKHAHMSARVLAVVICATALAGCDCTSRAVSKIANGNISMGPALRTPIPLPARALLNPQPQLNCESETTESKTDDRQKLDYERQCYRHAEMIVRSRLQLLQGSVDRTIKAIKRNERSASHQLSRD